MAAEHDLPTWTEISRHARASLDAARAGAADARDWLNSDWRPAGSSLPPQAGHARRDAQELLGQITDLIDAAKDALERAEEEQA